MPEVDLSFWDQPELQVTTNLLRELFHRQVVTKLLGSHLPAPIVVKLEMLIVRAPMVDGVLQLSERISLRYGPLNVEFYLEIKDWPAGAPPINPTFPLMIPWLLRCPTDELKRRLEMVRDGADAALLELRG